ncbi:metacaspase-1-like isoform X2 [Malania oleifera]|uniref:metacaspase-1-like isoform X2 n=1 Tax=Malania oleifera TaxID=397392 RepID=UPI0025ADCA38|nr:metacaspase-1-like isoform X2 [Malania oleifera]
MVWPSDRRGTIACSSCRQPLAAPPSARTLRCSICKTSTTLEDKGQSISRGQYRSGNAWKPELLSSCSSISVGGRKRALLCGVSYEQKGKYKLQGPVHDVRNMKELLIKHFGFPADSIRVLTEEMDEDFIPTKANMERSLRWLVEDCKPGDSLVFYFSGHGLRQPDFNYDELDGFDETLCPSDFKAQGMIFDNYINDTIVRPLVKDVTLHAIIDACHSGTALDLDYIYNKEKEEWDSNRHPLCPINKGTNGGLAICFSACRDDQIAADTTAFSKKSMSGALTSSFITTIKENPGITYGHLLKMIQEAIDKVNKRRCFKFTFLRKLFNRLLLQPTIEVMANVILKASDGVPSTLSNDESRF